MKKAAASLPRLKWARDVIGFRAVLLSETVTYLSYHFFTDPPRSIPCARNDGCIHCKNGRAVRHKFYAPSVLTGAELHIVEITPAAMQDLVSLILDGKGFRGIDVHLRRSNSQPGSRLVAKLVGRNVNPALPPSFAVLPTLIHLFGPPLRTENYTVQQLSEHLFCSPTQIDLTEKDQ
jgi:hypothetical protein